VALDFLTLYIVILLNSLTVSVIWAAIAASYRTLVPARYWLASCLLSMTGGAVLALQGNEGALGPAVAGNALVIFGFFQMWVGIRLFFGRRSGQRTAIALTLASMVAMVAFAGDDRARSIVYSLAQATPMALGIVTLLRQRSHAAGRYIAAFAMAVGIAGHTTTTISNLLVINDLLDYDVFYRIASFTLLCVIFSAVVWNFGFTVMTIDRLRAEVAWLAERDELTDLPNRRKLNERLREADRQMRRGGGGYSLLLIDLDHFKEINDAHGHAAGDKALVHVAQTMRKLVRDDDVLARFGGDEFCLLLPGASLAAAEEVAGKLIRAVRAAPLWLAGRKLAMTLSIGVATRSEGASYETALANADTALYEIKAAGRNGVGVFGRPSSPALAARKRA